MPHLAVFSCFSRFNAILRKRKDVFSTKAFANSAVIFAKADVKTPVQFVFDAPMAANHPADGFCVYARETADKITPFGADFIADDSLGFNRRQARQTWPLLKVLNSSNIFTVPNISYFNSAMSTISIATVIIAAVISNSIVHK